MTLTIPDKEDWLRYRLDLDQFDWVAATANCDLEQKIQVFNDMLESTVSSVVELKTVKTSGS